jgi:hypothetical protein
MFFIDMRKKKIVNIVNHVSFYLIKFLLYPIIFFFKKFFIINIIIIIIIIIMDPLQSWHQYMLKFLKSKEISKPDLNCEVVIGHLLDQTLPLLDISENKWHSKAYLNLYHKFVNEVHLPPEKRDQKKLLLLFDDLIHLYKRFEDTIFKDSTYKIDDITEFANPEFHPSIQPALVDLIWSTVEEIATDFTDDDWDKLVEYIDEGPTPALRGWMLIQIKKVEYELYDYAIHTLEEEEEGSAAPLYRASQINDTNKVILNQFSQLSNEERAQILHHTYNITKQVTTGAFSNFVKGIKKVVTSSKALIGMCVLASAATTYHTVENPISMNGLTSMAFSTFGMAVDPLSTLQLYDNIGTINSHTSTTPSKHQQPISTVFGGVAFRQQNITAEAYRHLSWTDFLTFTTNPAIILAESTSAKVELNTATGKELKQFLEERAESGKKIYNAITLANNREEYNEDGKLIPYEVIIPDAHNQKMFNYAFESQIATAELNGYNEHILNEKLDIQGTFDPIQIQQLRSAVQEKLKIQQENEKIISTGYIYEPRHGAYTSMLLINLENSGQNTQEIKMALKQFEREQSIIAKVSRQGLGNEYNDGHPDPVHEPNGFAQSVIDKGKKHVVNPTKLDKDQINSGAGEALKKMILSPEEQTQINDTALSAQQLLKKLAAENPHMLDTLPTARQLWNDALKKFVLNEYGGRYLLDITMAGMTRYTISSSMIEEVVKLMPNPIIMQPEQEKKEKDILNQKNGKASPEYAYWKFVNEMKKMLKLTSVGSNTYWEKFTGDKSNQYYLTLEGLKFFTEQTAGIVANQTPKEEAGLFYNKKNELTNINSMYNLLLKMYTQTPSGASTYQRGLNIYSKLVELTEDQLKELCIYAGKPYEGYNPKDPVIAISKTHTIRVLSRAIYTMTDTEQQNFLSHPKVANILSKQNIDINTKVVDHIEKISAKFQTQAEQNGLLQSIRAPHIVLLYRAAMKDRGIGRIISAIMSWICARCATSNVLYGNEKKLKKIKDKTMSVKMLAKAIQRDVKDRATLQFCIQTAVFCLGGYLVSTNVALSMLTEALQWQLLPIGATAATAYMAYKLGVHTRASEWISKHLLESSTDWVLNNIPDSIKGNINTLVGWIFKEGVQSILGGGVTVISIGMMFKDLSFIPESLRIATNSGAAIAVSQIVLRLFFESASKKLWKRVVNFLKRKNNTDKVGAASGGEAFRQQSDQRHDSATTTGYLGNFACMVDLFLLYCNSGEAERNNISTTLNKSVKYLGSFISSTLISTEASLKYLQTSSIVFFAIDFIRKIRTTWQCFCAYYYIKNPLNFYNESTKQIDMNKLSAIYKTYPNLLQITVEQRTFIIAGAISEWSDKFIDEYEITNTEVIKIINSLTKLASLGTDVSLKQAMLGLTIPTSLLDTKDLAYMYQ